MKAEPVGICDLCKGPIPAGDWYTRRGPRLYCCRDCRNTGNSRGPARPIRGQKARRRVALGLWQNPMRLRPPTGAEQAARARLGRLREVRAGQWHNPALTAAAHAKLSRPRKYAGDLARAIEKLKAGARVADLTPAEQEAHRAYRRGQAAALWARMPEERRKHRQPAMAGNLAQAGDVGEARQHLIDGALHNRSKCNMCSLWQAKIDQVKEDLQEAHKRHGAVDSML